MEVVTLSVDETRWAQAQDFELRFAKASAATGDDYNKWWRTAFGGYEALRGMELPNVLEVGCGPHTNVRLILPLIRFEGLWLEDPLIDKYLALTSEHRLLRGLFRGPPVTVAKLVRRHNATVIPEKLEDLPLPDASIDLCVCINVLDHVQDARSCMSQMLRVLRPGGILVVGQELSDQEDAIRCPELLTDVGHPIKINDAFLDSSTGGLHQLLKKVLPRAAGRNPRCHYGTYLLIGQMDA